jgi:hypothetical protein
MRKTLVLATAVLTALVGFGGVAYAASSATAPTTDPVTAWYQQVAQWRSCVVGVVKAGGSLADAKSQCGDRPERPSDPRLVEFRKAIEAWKQCVRTRHEAGLTGDALRKACPPPKPSDFGLPNPPLPPLPEWVARYRAALDKWRSCLRSEIASGKSEADAKADCGMPPKPQDFGAPVPTPVPLPLAAFRQCVEKDVKSGATLAAAYEACKALLPPSVLPPPLPLPPVSVPLITLPPIRPIPLPIDPLCIKEKVAAGLSPADAEAACRVGKPVPLPPVVTLPPNAPKA